MKKAAKRVKVRAPGNMASARTTTKPARTKVRSKSPVVVPRKKQILCEDDNKKGNNKKSKTKARAGKAKSQIVDMPPALEKLAAVPAATDVGIRSLPPRQRMFVAEYLANGMNATQAAIKAGYSPKTAESQGCRLLRNVKVAAIVAASMEATIAKCELTAQRVLDELEKLAMFDPRKLYLADGSMRPLHELDDVTAMGIKGFKYGKWGPDVKFVDKGINLERIGRHFQMFTDKVEHTGKVTLETLILGEDAGN